MKQTVEEAAREAIHRHYNCNGEYPCGERNYCIYCNGHNTAFDCCECGADEFKEGFIAGADWQSKQSPWISVKERLPEYNKKVIVLRGDECFISLMYNFGSDCWAIGDDQSNDLIVNEKDFWLPIPSFDEIIKANKDVLQRLKNR